MSSKRSRRKLPYCKVSQQTNQKWLDFTLQKNHIFGEDERGPFVVRGIDDRYIYIYRGRLNIPGAANFDPRPSLRGAYIWHHESINRRSIVGQMILEKHAEAGALPVEYKSTEKLVRELYNPRDTVWDSGFQKMPHMRIPMGSYSGRRGLKYKEISHSVNVRRSAFAEV